MANAYSVTIKSIATDGTNLFVTISIFDGLHTLPDITPVFPVGTPAEDIRSYVQTIADNQPALAADLGDLVSLTIAGA